MTGVSPAAVREELSWDPNDSVFISSNHFVTRLSLVRRFKNCLRKPTLVSSVLRTPVLIYRQNEP